MILEDITEDRFKQLRKNLRQKGKEIVDHVKRNHFVPGNFAGDDDVCSFCGTNIKLTKEHVLPKWSFQNDPVRYFITEINGTTQTFIKTTIPACQVCNNEILSTIEKYVLELFKNTNLDNDYFEYHQSLNVIRWLELIDYKFHILNFRRKYRKAKSEIFIPIFKDIPMSVMRSSIGLSPHKALSQLRDSRDRIKRREKDSKYYSLVFWKSKNKDPLFFHSMNEYIFLEFPEFKMALFFFYNKEFNSNYDAEAEARKIINDQYNKNKK